MAALRAQYHAGTVSAAAKRAAAENPEHVELSFHEVSGVRLERLMTLLRDVKTDLRFKMVAALLEPGRSLSLYFQNCAEGHLRNGRAHLCDLTFPSTSGLVAVLQYWSSLARGECRMFRMVWQHDGHGTFLDWCRERPQEL